MEPLDMGHDAPTAFGRRDLTSCRGVGCSSHLEGKEDDCKKLAKLKQTDICNNFDCTWFIFKAISNSESPVKVLNRNHSLVEKLTLGAVWNGHGYILATIIVLGFGWRGSETADTRL